MHEGPKLRDKQLENDLVNRKLLVVEGLGILRIKTIREQLTSLGILPTTKKEVMAWIMESPTISQNSL